MTHMTHTLRQPLYTVAATCVGLSLLLGACAPTTHQADPTPTSTSTSTPTSTSTSTPTSTSTSTPTATDGCAGYLLKAQEEALVRPRAANTDPAYYFYSSPDDRNQKRTSLKGGNGQGPYSWVNKDLSVGQSAVVDGVGTFTLLAITPGAREYNPRFITFCFDPDPSLDLNEEEMKKFSAR